MLALFVQRKERANTVDRGEGGKNVARTVGPDVARRWAEAKPTKNGSRIKNGNQQRNISQIWIFQPATEPNWGWSETCKLWRLANINWMVKVGDRGSWDRVWARMGVCVRMCAWFRVVLLIQRDFKPRNIYPNARALMSHRLILECSLLAALIRVERLFTFCARIRISLPSRFVRCGSTVIVLTAANSWSRTGCAFAPHESLPIQIKWPVLFARILAWSSFLHDSGATQTRKSTEYREGKKLR